jgi:hypothetical protein
MAARRRPLLLDLCLCALASTAAAFGGAVVARNLTSIDYRLLYVGESTQTPALIAAGIAWGLMAALLAASKRSWPPLQLALTQLSLGLLAGFIAGIARGYV